MEEELFMTEHRPYPLPSTPWIMTQTWEHLLFLHWRVPQTLLRPLLPPELELDTYEGHAWISALPFRVTHQKMRGLPEIPLFNTFLELNVRTYVKYKGFSGVYFFSLDANHPLAVCGARVFSLPYKHATMKMKIENQSIAFTSKRIFSNNGRFDAEYKPVSEPIFTLSGTLDSWLLERYCLFTKWGKQLLQGDIHHKKWEVSKVKVAFTENTVGPFGRPSEPPLLHYSSIKKTFIWPLKKVE
ncbi:MAG: DUF2071 domain-containing protein [Bacillota bacterium]|nr:DUF2071 domain-containing protein [Bacillota bacterium]